MPEWGWWVIIVFVTNALTAIMIIDTYRRRIFEIKRRQAQENERKEQEIAGVRMKSRVLDAIPVSRLIGGGRTIARFPEEGVVISSHDGAIQTMYLDEGGEE